MKTINYGPRERFRFHSIPVYDVTLEIVLTNSVNAARNLPKRVKWLGGDYQGDPMIGVFERNHRRACLMLERSELSHKLIAHETLHAVHGILELNGVRFGPDCCHETPALLAEYLAGLIYADLKSWGVKVK